MITLERVLKAHSILIASSGGSQGIRDMGSLEAAINRPFMTFDSVELYPTVIDKAAAVVESIVKNHPFVDGNKRSGYAIMRIILLYGGYDISATIDERYDFIILIAEGKLSFDEIKAWLSGKVNEIK